MACALRLGVARWQKIKEKTTRDALLRQGVFVFNCMEQKYSAFQVALCIDIFFICV